MTVTSWTFEHYNRPEVKEIILDLSREGPYNRWGNGDGFGWYKNESGKKKAYNLGDEKDYDAIVQKHRTLYWTLNLFDARIFDRDYNTVTNEESPIISRESTRGYMFGVDIDTVPTGKELHGLNIRNPEVKKAVEAIASYYVKKLKEHAPNSVHVLFSGGGIYVVLHHKIFEDYFRRYETRSDWENLMDILIEAMNLYLSSIRDSFFEEHPEYKPYVKPDILNNAKRVFKSIFSIHAKHSFSVIPMDPDNIVIDFDKATIPLSKNVIESGKEWYQTYDTDNRFLQFMKPYLLMAKDKLEYSSDGKCGNTSFDIEVDVSKTPIGADMWPPCIKNILVLQSCGEGRTRALAFFAAFLGQAGIPEDQAKQMFYGLARKWGATTSNIFESYYQKMHVPTCDKLRSNNNIGFPSGCSIKSLDVCKPDPRCHAVIGPRYYADKAANEKRLKRRLTREATS